jgi:hypothetical protein
MRARRRDSSFEAAVNIKRWTMLALLGVAPLGLGAFGTPGHVRVEARDGQGGWVEVGRLAYDLEESTQSLRLPAELAQPNLELRLSPVDGDETQFDALRLKADGRAVAAKSLTRISDGKDLRAKLARKDRDVEEMHGQTLDAVYSIPKHAQVLTVELAARASFTKDLAAAPFQIWDRNKPWSLNAKPGAHLEFATGKLVSGSGHPSAPILGGFKVKGDRLVANVEFCLDNDPGDDDYATVVAFDDKGGQKQFRVSDAERRWGKTEMRYGKGSAWEHRGYDFSIPLAELPRRADGSLGLGLLAYGTCNLGIDYGMYSIDGGSFVAGSNVTITANGYAVGYDTAFANTTLTGSSTAYLLDASGNTLEQQTTPFSFQTGYCSPEVQVQFCFPTYCAGYYSVIGSFDVTGDTVTANNFNVFGGSPVFASLTLTGSYCEAWPTVVPTKVPTQTPEAVVSGGGGAVVFGPVPAARGEDIHMASPEGAVVNVDIYNIAGERVVVSDGMVNGGVIHTGGLAKGVYLVRAALVGGPTVWKKIVIH